MGPIPLYSQASLCLPEAQRIRQQCTTEFLASQREKVREGTTWLCLNQRNLAATSKKLALPCSPVDIAVTSLCGGLDVLIHAEEIRWIVLVLDGGQALVVVPIGGFDALLAFFHHEIHVRAARRIGVQILPVLPGPVDDAVLVGRVG